MRNNTIALQKFHIISTPLTPSLPLFFTAGEHSGQTISLSSDGLTIAIGMGNGGGTPKIGITRVFQFSTTSLDFVQVGQDIFGDDSGMTSLAYHFCPQPLYHPLFTDAIYTRI